VIAAGQSGAIETRICSNAESTEGYFQMAETQVSIRIDLEAGERIGPGKIALLEAIRKTGSITAAAQSMQMSYRRAWLLVDELNKLLSEPVVTTTAGGVMGGGTKVTPVGEKTIVLYHSIEARTRAAARSELQAFRKLMRD
jgi:molybdate transport system regulatory protein